MVNTSTFISQMLEILPLWGYGEMISPISHIYFTKGVRQAHEQHERAKQHLSAFLRCLMPHEMVNTFAFHTSEKGDLTSCRIWRGEVSSWYGTFASYGGPLDLNLCWLSGAGYGEVRSPLVMEPLEDMEDLLLLWTFDGYGADSGEVRSPLAMESL